MSLRAVIAVIIAGIIGCIATGVVVTLLVGDEFAGFFTTWTKYVVSVAIAIPVPFIFRTLANGTAIVVGILWCGVVAALLTQFIFISPASWIEVRIFNAVYATVTVLVYRAIVGPVLPRATCRARG